MRNRPLLPVPHTYGDHPNPMKAGHTITHAPYTGSTVADGTQGPPQYGTPVTRNVYGWYPQSSQVPVGNDDVTLRVKTGLVVLVPDPSVYKAGDKVTINAAEYRVSEDVRDYTTGPFGYKPGGEIVVEKTSG
jgi:hypothetical protein